MAFGFSGAGQGNPAFGGQAAAPLQSGPNAQDGPELREISTSQVGFQAIAGDVKLKLLPSPWPTDALPPPSASLLSVASSKGLIAAAGPEAVVVTSTNSVRDAITKVGKPGDNIRTIDPNIKLPISRASHVVFSADENVLVISPQDGGLLVYQVDGLANGQTQPVLQIATNNTGLRALIPNPVPESAELFAAVTRNGELFMADLKTGGFRDGVNGPVLKNGVSCLSWSVRGKQLVAGLANGTVAQYWPDGSIVAEIPYPPSLEGNRHVSAISWLENDSFFVVYTPNETSSDGMVPQSDYYIVSRQPKTTNFGFQKLPEVVPAFGTDRLPSFQFIARLRNFKPHLVDLLLVASTASGDIGMVTRADAPLSEDEPVVGDFTSTLTNDDSRRAQLPLSVGEGGDTWPIGLALDLSSTDTVFSPIPSDPEIRESATPLPSLLVLNHEGLLTSWWIVYTDSIREKAVYPSLVVAGGALQGRQAQSQTPEPTSMQTEAPAQTSNLHQPGSGQPAFGQSSFGSSTTFAKPAATSFGASAPSAGFGVGSPAFGASSSLGGAKSSWTSTGFGSSTPQAGASGFGQPAFGSATPIGGAAAPTFGAPAALGSRPAPFGQAAPLSAPAPNTTPAFGKPAGLGANAASPFAGGSAASPFTTKASQASGFASFSGSGGFSNPRAEKPAGGSSFSQPGAGFGISNPSEPSIFGSKTNDSFGFGNAKPAQNGSLFGTGGSGFKLASSFKGDGTAKDDKLQSHDGGAFSFGSGLGDMLGENKNALSPTHDKETEMDEGGEPQAQISEPETEKAPPVTSQAQGDPASIVTPPSTVIQSKAAPAPPLSNLFGTTTQPNTTPAGVQHSKPAPIAPTTTPAPSQKSIFGTSTRQDTTPASVQDSKPSWAFGAMPSTTPRESPMSKTLPFGGRTKSPEQTPKIKTEAPSDDETQDLSRIPEAPLPPDPTSKTAYSVGDTSASSVNSKTPSDDAPVPTESSPTVKKDGHEADQTGLPSEGDFSSDYEEGTEEDASEDISPAEEEEEEEEGEEDEEGEVVPSVEPTEQIQMSPESSYGRGGGKSQEDSPTGGLFTKVTHLSPSQKPTRPLFGEVSGGPVFAPPKPQESPRSPSPVRNLLPHDLLRPEASRSVSAPSRPSAIDSRKTELNKSNLGRQQVTSTEFRAKEEERLAAAAEAKAKAESAEAQQLVDDEDERLQTELARPVSPCQHLDAFLHHEQNDFDDGTKSGIPGQIERLYQDINAMIDTLGINARSLSGYMLYQQSQDPNQDWPDVLKSATPLDSLNDEWVLNDITRLQEGNAVVSQLLEANRITDLTTKLQQCQDLLNKDLVQLKSKLISARKIIHARSDAETAYNAPLSAEQAALQHDLRKASTAVQTKLVKSEQNLTVLRAKLAEVAPGDAGGLNDTSYASLSRTASQKKPTVEAVTSTIAKMTSMAEKKSADIDVLEAQLRRVDLSLVKGDGSRRGSVEPNGTPQKAGGNLASSTRVRTPASATGSVYHTPESKFGTSIGTIGGTGRRNMRTSISEIGASVSLEDKERWREKARRKKEVERLLKEAVAERRRKKSRTVMSS